MAMAMMTTTAIDRLPDLKLLRRGDAGALPSDTNVNDQSRPALNASGTTDYRRRHG